MNMPIYVTKKHYNARKYNLNNNLNCIFTCGCARMPLTGFRNGESMMDTVKGVNERTEETDETARIPLMLLNISFEPGHCLERIKHIKNPELQDMALTEYYYFTCQHERAVTKAVSYLYHEDLKTQIGAWLIYIFGNMAMGNTDLAKTGIEHLRTITDRKPESEDAKEIQLLLAGVKLMLHFPISEEEHQQIADREGLCDEVGRLFGCYLMEQEAWKNGEYERAIGGVEAILLLIKNDFPLYFLYLYLTAASAALHLKDLSRAEAYFDKAWELARADGFYGPMGEQHGHLSVLVEKKIRKEDPEAYKKIMEVTHQYRTGWRSMIEGEDSSSNLEELTGMEYAVAQLAGLEWSNQEIADYLDITVRTVKYHMTTIFNKLNIGSRRELTEKMPR